MKRVSKKKGSIGYDFKENFIKLRVCLNSNQPFFVKNCYVTLVLIIPIMI
jgi:hypothetical protein